MVALAHGLGNDAHPVVTLGEEAAQCAKALVSAILAAWRQDG